MLQKIESVAADINELKQDVIDIKDQSGSSGKGKASRVKIPSELSVSEMLTLYSLSTIYITHRESSRRCMTIWMMPKSLHQQKCKHMPSFITIHTVIILYVHVSFQAEPEGSRLSVDPVDRKRC